jgi:hypothetical protein
VHPSGAGRGCDRPGEGVVIADEVSCLHHAHATAVEAAATGRHREKAEKDARVEVWSEPSGTAALAGRDLRPADVIAADKRIEGLARQLKAAGIEGSLGQLRARAYLALPLGQPMPGLTPPGAGQHAAGTAAEGALTYPVAGAVNLTIPLSSFLGGFRRAGRGGRLRPGDSGRRPGAGRPSRRRAWLPLVPDPHRPGRPGRGARLRACPAARWRQRGGEPRVGNLRHDQAAGRRGLPAPARIRWLSALPHAAARDQGPAADLFLPRLSAPGGSLRPGSHRAACPGRPDV